MNKTRIELHYLPNIAYFQSLLHADEVWIEAHEHFQKQTYRNRCRILTANGVQDLIIPIQHTAPKMLIRDVKIEYAQNWVKQHWGALVAAYAKSPYFEYFADDFQQIYHKKHTFLFDFNWSMLTLCLHLLRLKPTICLTESYQTTLSSDSLDLLSEIHPKKRIDTLPFYQENPYQQNFPTEFVSNLSIIDLLMCKGARAKEFL